VIVVLLVLFALLVLDVHEDAGIGGVLIALLDNREVLWREPVLYLLLILLLFSHSIL
jgi:hypothetical protein